MDDRVVPGDTVKPASTQPARAKPNDTRGRIMKAGSAQRTGAEQDSKGPRLTQQIHGHDYLQQAEQHPKAE